MADPTPGKFMWNELNTNDAGAAQKFYTTVVGWKTDSMPMPGSSDGAKYHFWKVGDDNVGGMFQMQGTQFAGVPPHWMSYVHVADVDACAAKVGPAGGKVAQPPFDIPGIGRMCVIIDPQGAALALMTPSPQMPGS